MGGQDVEERVLRPRGVGHAAGSADRRNAVSETSSRLKPLRKAMVRFLNNDDYRVTTAHGKVQPPWHGR
jgi:hypothetical protein